MQPLAARRTLQLSDGSSITTPALVPSFSSRVPEIDKILRASSEVIDKPFLISAYDVAREYVKPPFNFAGTVFLDSGGYEVGLDGDLSEVADSRRDQVGEWTREHHQEVLRSWSPGVLSVVISYDHPKIRADIPEQVARAQQLEVPKDTCVKELLVKPETQTQDFIDIKSLEANVRKFDPFCAIGVTEKEIGNSVLERMTNIARLRLALGAAGLHIPIHVFGSLDTITTYFYFVAGADIFDGLTWLRYAFKDGHTLYRQDFGISDIGISTKSPKVESLCWVRNYTYLNDMELEMRRFTNAHDFGTFKFHGNSLKIAFETIQADLKSKLT